MSTPPPTPVPALPDLHAAARERLLAAALAVAERQGVAALGIAAVARAADVSRPTVYRHFASRDELLRQTVLRAAIAWADALQHRLARLEGAGRRAVEAVLIATRELPAHPVLGAARSAFPQAAARAVTSPEALAVARRGLAPLVEAAGWDDAEAVEAVELLLRFGASLVDAPDPARDDDRLRRFLARRLLPAIGLASGGSG